MTDEQDRNETALTTGTREQCMPIKIGEHGVAFESAAEMFKLCNALVVGGVAPKGMTPGAVMASMLKGRALGLDEITSVTSIAVINGRTQMAGSLLLGLMRRAGIEYDIWHEGEANQRAAWIRAWWPGKKDRAKSRSFSMGDAARAGLLSKDSYRAWPDDMLLWRAVAKLARQEFPEIGAGIYVHGEVPGDPAPDVEAANLEPAAAPAPPPPHPLLAELKGDPTPFPSHAEADAALAEQESGTLPFEPERE